MNLRLYLANKIALAVKRRRLADIKKFILQLEDQIHSGQVCLYRYREIEAKLERQIVMIEDPADVVRRLEGAT